MSKPIVILSFVFGILILSSCDSYEEQKEYAEQIIEKVEAFRTKSDRFPKNIEELGLEEKMEGPAYYSLVNDSTYIVWYGINGVGNSMVYHSDSKTWNEEG